MTHKITESVLLAMFAIACNELASSCLYLSKTLYYRHNRTLRKHNAEVQMCLTFPAEAIENVEIEYLCNTENRKK